MLTRAQTEILELMLDTGEEMVADGIQVWVGDRRTSHSTLLALLRVLAVQDVSDVKGISRYVVDRRFAQALLTNPELCDQIANALRANTPFTLNDNNRLELI